MIDYNPFLSETVMISNTHAYVGLGSNLGDRAGHLLIAVRGLLDANLRVTRLSSIYETEPVGVTTVQPFFLNMVVELTLDEATAAATTAAVAAAARPTPEQLLARLLRIEYQLGRRRKHLLAPRTIDLDLLLYGNARSDTEYLMLPHPRLHLRRFVLAPLCELVPDSLHPTLGKTFQALLSDLADDARVERWSPAGATGDQSEREILD
jgi:2-amino-4-hydroxy-6-hydroxymethyldihydropteridine diphosphokinase